MRDTEPGLTTGLMLQELLFTRCVSALKVLRESVLQQSLIIHIKPPLCRAAEEGAGVSKSCFQGRRKEDVWDANLPAFPGRHARALRREPRGKEATPMQWVLAEGLSQRNRVGRRHSQGWKAKGRG